jgi:hypothetical protein
LEALSVSDLVSAFNADEMERLEIYPGGRPGGWSELGATSEESFGYFTDALDRVKELVTRGAARGDAMVAWLT